jgi:ComF family protein
MLTSAGAHGSIQSVIQGLKVILDWFYPPLCCICGKRAEAFPFLCESCFRSLPYFADTPETLMLHEEHAADDIICMYTFDQRIQQLIHLLKYQDMPFVGKYLGKYIGIRLKERSIAECNALLPVPLHAVRKRERGYNQSYYIAKGIADVWKVPVETALIKRQKNTRTQTRLNRRERRENMRNAFRIKRKIRSLPECICVVDDVFTTGATTMAVAERLKEAGARKVHILTLATPLKDQ